jgi:hypothetical protein
MDHPSLVGVREGGAKVDADLGDVTVGDRAVACQAVESVPVDQFGDQDRVAIALAELVERHDRGVVQTCGRLRFTQDAVGAGAFDLLDGDGALEPFVKGAVDGAHSAGADSLLDPEPSHDQIV